MESRDERIAAALAHALVAANWMGMVAAAVMWLTERERSPEVGFQALQALIFQLLGLILSLASLGLYVVAVAVAALIGFASGDQEGTLVGMVAILGIPGMMLIPLLFLAYGLLAARACLRGRPFEYLLLGPVLRRRLAGKEAVR